VGLAVAALAVRMFASLRVHNHEYRPFLDAQGLFLLCFLGLGISIFPYVIPTEIMIWEAAAPDNSLSFMLVGAIALVPLILGYTADAYCVFRGKIDPDAGYH
jgi:cytochrome d ubiquinol oxidase subunit II